MDLKAGILRVALSRPAVLMAVCPGATEVRLRLEQELCERGWPLAAAPAAANVLAVVGEPEPDARLCEALWGMIPAPRARIHLRAGNDVAATLDEVAASLLRTPQPNGTRREVPEPAMADRADDRDGLRLDQLHLPLGPALLDWPAGLVLRLAMQGDVIQRARVERTCAVPGSGPPFWDEPWLRAAAGERVFRGEAARRLCAAHLDSAGRLLAVAGWRAAARWARAARDAALAGRPAEDVVARVGPLVRRVGRSRTLRLLVAGLGELSTRDAIAAGVTGPALRAGGDVWDRLTRWLAEAARSAALCDETRALDVVQQWQGPRGVLDGPSPPSQALLNVIPRLLEGTEFAGARLIVASLDPDLDELVPARTPQEVPRG